MNSAAVVSSRGASRWLRGHPWIFRSDVIKAPDDGAGAVLVLSERSRPLGWALWSPHSQIALRLLDTNVNATIDAGWWRARIGQAIDRRRGLDGATTAYRLIHGEGDACPSIVCDRYDRWLVLQILSAGAEQYRHEIVTALQEIAQPEGILARHDVAVRSKEKLPQEIELLSGSVPHDVEVEEHGVRYLAAPWTGQKTGAFLDQRENRRIAGTFARGTALDCFSYHGSFAIHLARRASHVTALDTSASALARARDNAALNGLSNVETLEADAFDYLKSAERSRTTFDTVVLDPPAFAKTRSALPKAINGYKEINLRAMRLLTSGGVLFTASCSFHLSKALFIQMLEQAAADSGRRMVLHSLVAQPVDHPEILTIPETGYIKGAVLIAQ